jgi:hypothetical protein
MSKPGTWGGELEVRALALRLGVTIHVHYLSRQTEKYMPHGPSTCDIHIGFLDFGRYVSLLRTAKCTGWRKVQPLPSAQTSHGTKRHTFQHFDQGEFGLPGPCSVGRFTAHPARVVQVVVAHRKLVMMSTNETKVPRLAYLLQVVTSAHTNA